LSALSSTGRLRGFGPGAPGAAGPGKGRFVLPRPLRRPARFGMRLVKGEWTPPRFAASLGAAFFLAASGAYGAVIGGHAPAIVEAVAAHTGMAVDKISVTGNIQTSEIDILDRLGLDGWTSLVGFDPEAARQRIEELPWIKSAAVRKTYPRTLAVEVAEREPFAVWQHDNKLTVIERDGDSITEYRGRGKSPWPLIVGVGAPAHAEDFMKVVAGFPDLSARVKGYVRVGDRRWDVKFDSGVTVKLPEDAPGAALAEVSRLNRESSLLDRDIAAVDLRLADRMVVELTPEAMEARTKALADQDKARKKAARQGGKV
jgi:cell division protein FtsQ